MNATLLKERWRAGDLLPVIGAGLSSAAGLPNWQKLIAPLGQELGVKVTKAMSGPQLLQVAQDYENLCGFNELARYVRKSLEVPHVKLTRAHGLLPTLIRDEAFTTNFDNLIERSFTPQNIRPIVRPLDIAYITAEEPRLYKLCGDLAFPDTLKITTRSFSTVLTFDDPLIRRFRAAVESKFTLFIGYSFSDPFVDAIWETVRQQFGAHKPRGVMLSHQIDERRRIDLQSKGIDTIELSRQPSRSYGLYSWLNDFVS